MTIIDGDIIYANESVEGYSLSQAVIAYNFVRNSYTFTNTDPVGVDKFTDSNGVNNTVDTGTSTALYNSTTLSYELTADGDASNDNEGTLPNPVTDIGSANQSRGMRIQIVNNCVIKSITKHASCTATRAKVLRDDGTLITSASFSGNTATFTITGQEMLKSGNYYRLECDNSGSNYTTMRYDTAAYPYNGTNFNYTHRSQDGTGTSTDYTYNITSVISQNATYNTGKTVETNEIISLAVAPKSILVYGHKTLPTNTSITVDVSDDGGTSFEITGQSLNSYIDTSTMAGTSLSLKFTLATSDTSVTPLLYGYSVIVTDR